MAAKTPKYVLIDGCPCPYSVAPYVYLVLRKSGERATSLYRGDDPAAKPLLRRYGKHTQRELANASPQQRAAWGVTGGVNPAGRSMHELRSDAVAKRGPAGRELWEWEIGIDAGPNTDANRSRIRRAAESYGLSVYFPYPSKVEYHHFGFKSRPKVNRRLTKTRVRITRMRLRVSTRRTMKGHWS